MDTIWPAKCREQAHEEGWELALTVDEHMPIESAYLHIYHYGPTFKVRNEAARHVLQCAQGGSKLHIRALSACQATRSGPGTKGKKR